MSRQFSKKGICLDTGHCLRCYCGKRCSGDGLQAVKRQTRPGGFDAGSGQPEKYLRSEARKMLNPKCVTFLFSPRSKMRCLHLWIIILTFEEIKLEEEMILWGKRGQDEMLIKSTKIWQNFFSQENNLTIEWIETFCSIILQKRFIIDPFNHV